MVLQPRRLGAVAGHDKKADRLDREGGEHMIKTGFVAAVANKANLTQAEAGRLVDAVLAAVTETLARGEDIRLTGFGSFEVVEQAARTGRNPRTGQEIAIPASKAPKFRPGTALKAAVGGTGQEA